MCRLLPFSGFKLNVLYLDAFCTHAACAPKLWNSLPLSLRDPTLTLTSFCSRLTTHLLLWPTGAHSWLVRLKEHARTSIARYKFSHNSDNTSYMMCTVIFCWSLLLFFCSMSAVDFRSEQTIWQRCNTPCVQRRTVHGSMCQQQSV